MSNDAGSDNGEEAAPLRSAEHEGDVKDYFENKISLRRSIE
jgi:hypothetical protein